MASKASRCVLLLCLPIWALLSLIAMMHTVICVVLSNMPSYSVIYQLCLFSFYRFVIVIQVRLLLYYIDFFHSYLFVRGIFSFVIFLNMRYSFVQVVDLAIRWFTVVFLCCFCFTLSLSSLSSSSSSFFLFYLCFIFSLFVTCFSVWLCSLLQTVFKCCCCVVTLFEWCFRCFFLSKLICFIFFFSS